MIQSLKICYVADASNIHVKRLLSFFVERGHEVFCFSDKGGEGVKIPGVEVIPVPNRDDLLAAGKPAHKTAVLKARTRIMKRKLKEIRPDILHAVFLYQRGWSAAYTGYHPLVITLLGSDIYLPEHNYRNGFHLFRDKLLNALSLRQADLISAVTDTLAREADKMTFRQVPTELIPIGTDQRLFQPELDTEALRERLDIPDDAFVILSPRQITPLYNQDIIIQSIPKVLKDLPNAIFLMKDTFCETEERKAYVASLKEQAEALGVAEAIRWDAEVPLQQLPFYYNLSDVVISVPSSDGMPVTVFDAMACRKPLIVGDLPSYNEVIVHGQTGLRVPLRNSHALAHAIVRIARNPDLVQRMVDESQVVLQQYGLFDQQMYRMERYYYSLANRSVSSRTRLAKLFDRLWFKLWTNLT